MIGRTKGGVGYEPYSKCDHAYQQFIHISILTVLKGVQYYAPQFIVPRHRKDMQFMRSGRSAPTSMSMRCSHFKDKKQSSDVPLARGAFV
jgi:hypothetical protein